MDSINVDILALVLIQLIYIGTPPISFAHTITDGRAKKSTITGNIAPDKNCTKYGYYLELLRLTELDPCLNRSVDIWEPLNELLDKQNGTYDCVDSIIKTLSTVFEPPLQKDCNCTGATFHLPYQNISYYNHKIVTSHPSSTTTKRSTASSNHPSTMSSTLAKVITTTSTHLPTVLRTTTKTTPPSTTTVMTVTIAPPPRHGGLRRFVSDSVTTNVICLTKELAFKELYELFYVHMDPDYPDEIIHYAPSLSHQHVWKKLFLVQPNCRKLLIQDLANTYGYNRFQVNFTCHPGHVPDVTTATTHTEKPTTALKNTMVPTQHQNLSSHTTGHGPTLTTAKTHTTMHAATLKSTMVPTQHQTPSTHTTGHGPTLTTAKTHTAIHTTTMKSTMVPTQHQTFFTHTTGHGPTATTATTHTVAPTTTLKSTMVPTRHQTLSTHTIGHSSTVTTATTHTAVPTTTLKTTMAPTQHQTSSTHTTGHSSTVTSATTHTAVPTTTLKTTMVPTQHQTSSTHTTGHSSTVTTATTHTAVPTTTLKTTMVPTQHQTLSTRTTAVTVPRSSTVSHTATPAVTMQTTESATTTNATCDGKALAYSIEHQVVLSASPDCPSKVFHSEEVFNVHCAIGRVYLLWRRGPKVLEMCQLLPINTAVATFGDGTFDPNRDIAAIFMGCIDTDTGFRAAIALCNAATAIQNVTSDNAPFFHSPDDYYVVQSVEA